MDIHRQEPDLRHVVVEDAHLFGRQLAEVDMALASDPQDVVVDIGHVAHAPNRETRLAEAAMQHIEGVIDEGVTEVRQSYGVIPQT